MLGLGRSVCTNRYELFLLNHIRCFQARAREYTRAVTAAKLDRMFAKPL